MKHRGMGQLARAATLLAAIAACTVAFLAWQLSLEQQSTMDALQWTALFGCWCFVLAWPAVFLVGWVLRRRAGRA